MTTQWVAVSAAVVAVATLVLLMRGGRLREKYAGLWLVVGGATIVIALWPGLLGAAARLTGVVLPSNLVFFMALVLLVGVCLHLSLEVSRLEDETRILAEEIAIANLRLDRLQASGQSGQDPVTPVET